MPEASLLGARVRRARWNPGARTFELQFETADAQLGPVVVLLRYRNVSLLEPALPALAGLVENPALRVVSDTLEQAGEVRSHRIGFGAGGEIVIACAAVLRTESPWTGTDYGETGYRFDVLSC